MFREQFGLLRIFKANGELTDLTFEISSFKLEIPIGKIRFHSWKIRRRNQPCFGSRCGPDCPGASRRYFVLGKLNTPSAGFHRSSSWSTARRSARVRTLRERVSPAPFFKLLSMDIEPPPPNHPTPR